MNKTNAPINITILGKEYLVSCQKNEEEALRNAAEFLKQKINETKKNMGVIGTERIAIMTALNIANELLTNEKKSSTVDDTLKRLQHKIYDTLAKDTQIEKVDVDIEPSLSQNSLKI